MDTTTQIIVSGLTLGAMYAISTVSLSLIWGALNVLNMAQGALLTFGGYVAYSTFTALGLPVPLAIIAAILMGGLFKSPCTGSSSARCLIAKASRSM